MKVIPSFKNFRQSINCFLFPVFLLFIVGCASCNQKNSSQTIEPKKFIVFLDLHEPNSKYNIAFFDSFFLDKIFNEKNKNKISPLSLSVFPLSSNTVHGTDGFSFELQNKDCEEIRRTGFKGLEEAKKKYISNSQQLAKLYNNNTGFGSCRIFESIPILRNELKKAKSKYSPENIYVIYFSDMVEINQPFNPRTCVFPFIKKGKSREIAFNSIQSATFQLDSIKDDSPIHKKYLSSFNLALNSNDLIGINTYIYTPGTVSVKNDSQNNSYEDIRTFWDKLFSEINLSPIWVKSVNEISIL